MLEPGDPPVIKPRPLAPSPLWGDVTGGVIYAYHNPTWNSTTTEPHRQLSRLDLKSGEVKVWELPDDWDASDLTVVNGEIILTKWETENAEDGLFSFDMTTGDVLLRMKMDDASRVLAPH